MQDEIEENFVSGKDSEGEVIFSDSSPVLERRRDLKGIHLKAVYADNPPFFYKKGDGFTGLMFEVSI